MSEELRPCPFCGSDNVKSEEPLDVIYCLDCGAEMATDLGDWNTRPIEDELRKRIVELESAQRWAPLEDPPKFDGRYLLHSGEWVRTAFRAEFADEFVRHYTHWMYAPQPPEVQE